MSGLLRYGILSQGGVPASSIVVDFSGSTTVLTNNSDEYEAYKELVIVGSQVGDVFTLGIDWLIDITTVGPGTSGEVHWSKNSTVSWTEIASVIADDNDSYDMVSIAHGDVIRIKIHSLLGDDTQDIVDTQLDLTGGAITTGTGTVTASGTTNWDHVLSP